MNTIKTEIQFNFIYKIVLESYAGIEIGGC